MIGFGAFALSLAAGAWLFLVVLAHPTPSSQPWVIPVDVALLGAFALHHSVMARARAKAWLARRLPVHLERAVFVWTASLLFLAVCILWQPIAGTAWRLDGVLRAGGYALQGGGVLVTLHSARLLDLSDLAGIRQVQQAMPGAVPWTRPPDTLTRRGAYGWVRHPIYFGWLLMTVPCPDMTTGRLVFALATTAYLVLAIPFEERALLAFHGEDYRRYMHEVRWRMLPWIY
jgi:hypothetical protein